MEVDAVGVGEEGRGERWMSGRLTTEREPRVRGCSGSVIGAMRSVERCNVSFVWSGI